MQRLSRMFAVRRIRLQQYHGCEITAAYHILTFALLMGTRQEAVCILSIMVQVLAPNYLSDITDLYIILYKAHKHGVRTASTGYSVFNWIQ